MIRTKLWLLCSLLFLSIGMKAEWTDVTNIYLANPSFDNNSSAGWTLDVSAQANAMNFNCMEVFNGTFDVSQTLKNLQKGKYRLSVQGYYRAGSNDVAYQAHQNGDEQLTAVLYAGDSETTLHSVYDFHYENSVGSCWTPNGSEYYPNGMNAGFYAFEYYDEYQNTLEFEAEGDVQIGIRNSSYINTNWCQFDNFKLEYNGTINQVLVKNVTLNVPKTTLEVGEQTTATATVSPSNATVKTLRWESSNPFVFTVDQNGGILARRAGQATLTVSTVDGSNIQKTVTITVTSSEQPDTRTWVDLTDEYLSNPDFAVEGSTDGWNVTGGYAVKSGCIEYWNNSYFRVSQTLQQLPKGHYRLSAHGFHRFGDPDSSYSRYLNNQPDAFARLFAGEQETVFPGYFDSLFEGEPSYYGDWKYFSGYYFPNQMWSAAEAFIIGGYPVSVEFDVTDADADVEIGVVNEDYYDKNWCIFSNFKLEYNGQNVIATNLQLSLAQTILKVGETAQIQAVITPSNVLVSSLDWTSDNPSVAVVDSKGLVTANGVGTAHITATTVDGSNISRTITITVVQELIPDNALFINEVMASNVDEYISPAFNFDGWIEIYNSSNKSIALAGLYLSDDATMLAKWRIPVSVGVVPAKGYKVIWFDSNNIATENAPFKLDVDGGYIHLSDESGKIIISQNYPASKERVSYARTTDGGNTWSTTGNPTPGASNATSTFAQSQLEAPLVDQPSRLFDGPFTATVTIPAGTKLRYTMDASLPTLENGYDSADGIFQISSTTNLRLRLFSIDGSKLPSRVTTCSYILRDKEYTLPIVSVVGDDRFFNSTDIGVFAKGPNGRPGNGQSEKCNWNMDWERPVNFSYLDANGDMQFNQDVDLEMCGGWSRAWWPHSFKLKGNKEYGGNKHLEYPFFDQKPYIRNRTLQIRNGGNEYDSGRFKDAALGTILQTSGMQVDVQSYQPVHEFINGNYIGVLNVREPNNKHYAYANYGYDDDEIDLFEIGPDSGLVKKVGTLDGFEEVMTLSESAANSETFAELCRRINMDEYINYMAAEFYLGSTDWPQNNVKAFTLREGGRWRFVFFDVDFAFNTSDPFNLFMSKEWYNFNDLYPRELGHIYAQIKFVTLFKNLLQNATFRRRFIDAFCLMGGSVYEVSRVTEIVDSLASRVAPAMLLEGYNMNNKAKEIKSKLNGRLSTATSYLRNYAPFELTGTTAQNVTLSSDVEGAQLLINGQKVPTDKFNGKLFAPVTLKAVAPAGYTFQGWVNNNGANTTTLKAMESSWTYYDQGSLDGKNWTASNYSTSGWKQGKAPLGYSNKEGIITTTIDYGSDSNNKRPTYYFRTSVNLSAAPASSDVFTMDYYIDDGLVVYVNGTEAGRFNMPSGTVNYSTLASTYADQFPTGTLTLPTSLFKKGQNVIAVEVHNNAANSTDIIFDAAINAQLSGSSTTPTYYATDAEIALPNGTVNLTASYKALTPQELKAQGINPVRINEVSGSNNTFISDYWKKGDWVELYNTTNEEIDVEGMFLTDNMEKPEKCMLTKGATNANTKIPAHGYLIVWCDKNNTTDRALHASFKISGEGGVVALTAADRSWTDELYYTAHDANSTIGRYPDGSADVYTMDVATIAETNMLTSYLVKIDQEEQKQTTGIAAPMIASANGFRIAYGSGQLLIKSEEKESVVVEIFTTDGRMVDRMSVELHQGTTRVSVAHLPSGFYVARATNEQSTAISCKFVR